jgi:hypothetical protein
MRSLLPFYKALRRNCGDLCFVSARGATPNWHGMGRFSGMRCDSYQPLG